ncbi:MAG: ABC transporter permease [Planctomycetota bacterium]|nr:ABC transporter permease [Planctomycetota bacterium]
MNLVALKMLLGDKLKYIALVAGLAFAALLVTQQASIFTGYAKRTGAWIRDTGAADLWVMDPQLEFTEDRKPLLDTALSRVRGVDGVEWAVPLYKGWLRTRLPDGTLVTTRVIGLDDATLVGAPPEMIEGQLEDLRRDRTIFVHADQVGDALRLREPFAGEGPRPLRVGDVVSINDHQLEVAGVYRSTAEFFWDPLIFTTYSRALSIAPAERKQNSFVLVKVRPGEDVALVAERIGSSTGLVARTPEEFESVTMNFVLSKTGILINFGVTIVLGFVVGALAAGQTFYMFVLDHLRHYATIKAMGASTWMLIRMVALQVSVVATIGYGIGVGAAAAAGVLTRGTGLAFEMPWQVPVLGGFAILFCALAAGLLGLVRVLRVEPAVVFKG